MTDYTDRLIAKVEAQQLLLRATLADAKPPNYLEKRIQQDLGDTGRLLTQIRTARVKDISK